MWGRLDYYLSEAGILHFGGDPDAIYELPNDRMLTAIAWVFARLDEDEFGCSLAPSSPRDTVHLNNLLAAQRKQAKAKGSSGSPELDAFSMWASTA